MGSLIDCGFERHVDVVVELKICWFHGIPSSLASRRPCCRKSTTLSSLHHQACASQSPRHLTAREQKSVPQTCEVGPIIYRRFNSSSERLRSLPALTEHGMIDWFHKADSAISVVYASHNTHAYNAPLDSLP